MVRTLLLAGAAALSLAACAATTAEETYVSTSGAPDIVDTAIAAGDFSTLVAAVQAGGLVETLKSPGPFTVFAPTDAAFAALPPGAVDNLLKPENKAQLVEVLTYHVLPGETRSDALIGKSLSADTVQGKAVSIDATGGSVMVNDAQVIAADIAASNGVIHVIDKVLLP